MYVDIHCHPQFKTFIGSEHEAERKNCWTNLNFDVGLGILDSQSSLSQLVSGQVKLAVVPLYALENVFAKAKLIQLAAGLSHHAKKRFLQKIEREEYGYFELMQADLNHLLNSANISPDKQFRLLSAGSQFDPTSSHLQIMLCAEGGHNFYDNGQRFGQTQKVIDRLLYFKLPQSPRLVYVTITHLSHSEFCTHAFGMKMLKSNAFNPKGKGLSNLGKRFIREALSTTNGKRILIDVKHMSVLTRQQFYALRAAEFPDAPIMASHMGLTGCSWQRKPVRKYKYDNSEACYEVTYYRQPGVLDTYFNPWSINLYDEDISEILLSNGLIGLSLDQRILGCGTPAKELVSPDEFKEADFKPVAEPRMHQLRMEEYDEVHEVKAWHLRHLCNHILHIVKVGRPLVGDRVWKQIAIGSDFDGLIDPINYTTHAGAFKFLFGGLVEWLPRMAVHAGVELPPADVQQVVKQVIGENAATFLRKHI
ncbi:MAG: membrane dipeptidase [Cyclobacteriaceae bacterium]|nr:membrane dipeptidase [Cyclobacteriaceae bacterium]